jgi:GcrA cell cycle regulator
MTWTDARIAQLMRLWTEGVSASGIAEALGDVSRSAVLGKLHRLRLLRSRKPASTPRRYDGPALVAVPLSSAMPACLVSACAGSPAGRPIPATAPEPPRSPWREAAFKPLPGTTPRPWLSRTFGECAFPVGEDADGPVSCCAKVKPRGGYCPAHHAIAFKSQTPTALAAEQRRWAEAANRWAA